MKVTKKQINSIIHQELNEMINNGELTEEQLQELLPGLKALGKAALGGVKKAAKGVYDIYKSGEDAARMPNPQASAGATSPAQSGFDLSAAGEHEVQPSDVISSEPVQTAQQSQKQPLPVPGAKQQASQPKKPAPQQKTKHVPRAGQINVARVVGDGMQQALRTSDPKSQKVLNTLRPQITNLVTKFVNNAVKNSGKNPKDIKIIQMGYGKQQPAAVVKPTSAQPTQSKIAENLEESEKIIHDYLLTEFLKLTENFEIDEIIDEGKKQAAKRARNLGFTGPTPSSDSENPSAIKKGEKTVVDPQATVRRDKSTMSANVQPSEPVSTPDISTSDVIPAQTTSISSTNPPASGTTSSTDPETAHVTFAPEPQQPKSEPDVGSTVSMPFPSEMPPEIKTSEPVTPTATTEPTKPQRARTDVASVEKGTNSLRGQLLTKYGTQLGKEANNALLMIARNIKAELAANGIKVQENKLQESKVFNRWQKLAGIIKG